MKKNITILSSLVIVISLFSFATISNLGAKPHSNIFKKIVPIYAADFSNDGVLVGASHNIFIGKVIRKIRTQNLGVGPETQFDIEVLENIKGQLNGTVVVDQRGGYENGVLYTVEDDGSTQKSNPADYLLQPGSIYILATRYNKDQNWFTLNSSATARKILSSNARMTADQARNLAETDSRVQELKAAYPHEILIDADVKNDNTLNSYVSVQAAGSNAPDATVALHQAQ